MSFAATAVTVAGAAVSAYGSYSSGRAKKAISQMNASQQEKNARMEYLSLVSSSNLQKASAVANYKLRALEAKAKENNALSIENQALGGDNAMRANLERFRDNANRVIAKQRGQIAASGMVEGVGTPLDILAESAGNSVRQQQDILYANELARTNLQQQAAMERFSGQVGLVQAGIERKSALRESALRAAQAKAGYSGQLRGAAITRVGGSAEATAGAIQGGATLLSGVGQGASMMKK
ncbi:hypothetical protein UFOVP296_39 [uncultured Caudovirales phage]|uniref:Internal virion protein n=1 Tax=uncultured Caudovirales phage TaxID=2100421 RepID=A0A6J5LSS8_9CAUD|nr:hypothetical protein UFOVP296_39 [uncultured Caudovirales phage]CAB4169886.1 hypothetical protein UFOVP912_14 [uncultured Caudovirales phage]CAB4198939.1 hypothetical protein UFOVP1334_2 [uncultured Caudovirales phage]